MKVPVVCMSAAFFLAICMSLCAQTAVTAQTPVVPQGTVSSSDKTTEGKVPDTYRTLALGMDIEAVKKELLADSLFGYRGERDVSLLPTLNRTLIETVGSSFILRSWFQFYEEKLYIMTFTLNPDKIDYYTIYSSLVQKYGEPVSLDPRKAVWSDDRVTLSLERPLTVKYVDTKVFTGLLEKSGTEKALSDTMRENFVNEF